jgi:hypothetical protein
MLGTVWRLGFLVSVESLQEIGEIVGGELPLEGFDGHVVATSKRASRCSTTSRLVKSLGTVLFVG